MKAWLLTVIIFAFSTPSISWAQFNYSFNGQGNASASLHGTGVWGGSQGCGYPTTRAETRDQRKLREKNEEYSKLEAQLDAVIARTETSIERIENHISPNNTNDVRAFIIDYHYNSKPFNTYAKCDETASKQNAEAAAGTVDDGKVNGKEPMICPDLENNPCPDCLRYIDHKKNNINGLCSNLDLMSREGRRDGQSTRSNICSSEFRRLKKYIDQEEKLQKKLDKLYDQRIDLEDKIEYGDDKNNPYVTEAGNEVPCEDCEGEKKNSVGDIVSKYVLPVFAGYVGYKGVKYVTDANKELGYPGAPVAGAIGGLMALQGIYGASNSGVARGAYGCGNVAGNGGGNILNSILGASALAGGAQFQGAGGGVFGYPQSLYNNPFGGGVFNQGTLPGGGIPGYGNGGFNIGIGGQFGIGGGNPYGNGGFGGGPFGNGGFGGGPFGNGGFGGGNPFGNGGQFGVGVGINGQFGIGGNPFGNGGQFGIGGNPFGNGGQFGIGNNACNCIVAPCNCGNFGAGTFPNGGFGANGQFGGGFNSQSYQYQQQIYQQQLQLQIQIQQEQAAKAAQVSELQQQIFEINNQINQISGGGSFGFNNGFSTGFSFDAGVNINSGVNVNTGIPGITPIQSTPDIIPVQRGN